MAFKCFLYLLTILLLAVISCTSVAQPSEDGLTLDQIMAHPDWIGSPVEQIWWAADSQQIYFLHKRIGSTVRDTYMQSIDAQASKKVEDAQLASIDAANPIFNAEHSLMAYIRNDDVFVRDLRTAALTQVTRSVAIEADLLFSSDGRSLLFRQDNHWLSWDPAQTVLQPVAIIKAEKDPAAEPDKDALRDLQLRLISTLKREEDNKQTERDVALMRQRSDATRAPIPIWLGDKITIVTSVLSPNRRWLLVVTEAKKDDNGRVGKMPKYVTESGYEEVEDVRTRVGRNPPQGQQLRLIDLNDGSVREISFGKLPAINKDPLAVLRKAADQPALKGDRAVRIDAIRWRGDGQQVAVMLRATDNKDRWITTMDFAKAQLRNAHHLHDPAWINWEFNEFGWLPDQPSIWFLSEHTGYSHLYLVEPGKRPRALTQGQWEASKVAWSVDGRQAFFLCNRKWPGDYEICSVTRDSSAVQEITTVDSVEDFVLSPDGKHIALRISAHHTPPQLAVIASEGGSLRQLTDTRTTDYKKQQWQAPEFVKVPSKHGAGTIWGKLYKPVKMDADKKYPVVLFVHGAGYLQNVHARWPVYFREQMFHQLLTERGFLVLDLDFRASEGYGRVWRTAIYRQMGHPELEDYLDGIDWLIENHQADRQRVGIYGGSYGGFMTFMAMFRQPDVFKAGAALRPVTDWTSYNHEYTSNILNTPDIDPQVYQKSSPIEYAQNLQGHLLIAHGMLDDNVFYQDSVRLTQRLIELKKHNWELASYPLERHTYQHPESWYDQYRRILHLFETVLLPAELNKPISGF